VVQRIKRYELPEDFTVVCDTWPYGRDSSEMLSRLTQVWDLRP
jgi:primary-amine oxidase